MKLDPMQRGRDFTTGQHPRRGPKSTQRQLAEVNTRLTTAFDAFGGGGDAGSALVLDGLPDVDESYVGKTVVVRTPAGQPAGVYTGSQDAFDNPVWVPQTGADPASWVYQSSFGPTDKVLGGVAVSPLAVYVTRSDDGAVDQWTHDGTFVASHSPTGLLDHPVRLWCDPVSGNIGVTGWSGDGLSVTGFQVWDEALSGLIFEQTTAGTGDGEFAAGGYPFGIVTDALGNWYLADTINQRVQKFDSDGDYVTQWGSLGSGEGEFGVPMGLAVDLDDNIHVVDRDNYRVQKFESDGTFVLAYGAPGPGPGQFTWPGFITCVDNGMMIISDQKTRRVTVWSSGGEYVSEISLDKVPGGNSYLAGGLADYHGNLYLQETELSSGFAYGVIRRLRAAGATGAAVVVAKNAAVVSGAARILDFSDKFTVTESPAGEANIDLDYGTITVGLNGSVVSADIGALDFSSKFLVTESPTGEANIDLDYGTIAVGLNGSLVAADASVLDFSSAFTVTESPAGEANIGLAELPGLVMLGSPATFSAQSSVSLNNVFTSAYRNYRLIINIDSATSTGTISARMRASGSDVSSANYERGRVTVVSTASTVGGANTNGGTEWPFFGALNGAVDAQIIIDLCDPQTSRKVNGTYQLMYMSTATSAWTWMSGGLAMRVTTAFDGISLIISSGNMTGKVAVYGWND